jgi:hypothetical protein
VVLCKVNREPGKISGFFVARKTKEDKWGRYIPIYAAGVGETG